MRYSLLHRFNSGKLKCVNLTYTFNDDKQKSTAGSAKLV